MGGSPPEKNVDIISQNYDLADNFQTGVAGDNFLARFSPSDVSTSAFTRLLFTLVKFKRIGDSGSVNWLTNLNLQQIEEN